MKKLVVLALLISLSACHIPKGDRYDPIATELSGKGVKERTTVARDHNGIAHIKANNQDDLFFAVGYSMAQDRFIQMDLIRRAGAGRLSELLGSPIKLGDFSLPQIDLAIRTFRFEESAKKGVADLDPESRAQLVAFTRGVNQFLKDGGGTMGIYKAWHLAPEPWRMEDTFLCSDLMGLVMAFDGAGIEYYLERIRVENGEAARDLFVPDSSHASAIISLDEPITASAAPIIPSAFSFGSNNWALAGSRTVSGLPLLNNDPHVPSTIIPTFWWHCQLTGAGYDVMGLMFTGLPTFGAATNGKLGWALTNVMADYMDLWRERVNPANPEQYQATDGTWKDFGRVDGEVKIKGKAPLKYTMRTTAHGVVVDQRLLGWKVLAQQPGEVMVIRYVDLDHARFYRGYQAMARATNLEEWKAGAADESWGPFAWNHLYVDKDNIAYWASGHFPIRKDNQGSFVRRGWEADQDWQGYVPFAENPHLVNPKKGYLASANNRADAPGYPYYITSGFLVSSRAERISRLIEEKPKQDVADMQRIQYDVVDLAAKSMTPTIIEDLKGATGDVALARTLLEEFAASGFRADEASRGVCVYMVFMEKFRTATFGDELGSKATPAATVYLLDAGLARLLDQPDNPWWDDVKTKAHERRPDIVRRTMLETIKYLRKELGNDPAKWHWGNLSQLHLSPFFVPLPGELKKFNRGPFPLPGTQDTIRAGDQVFMGSMGFESAMGPSTHFIVDFQNPRRAYFNCTAGMSDNPAGGRYDNLTADWLAARYQVMSMDEADWRPGMMGEVVFLP